jgi:Glycosyl hydrolase family 115/Gylcosyl hydrolase family 115 C-terminal domain
VSLSPFVARADLANCHHALQLIVDPHMDPKILFLKRMPVSVAILAAFLCGSASTFAESASPVSSLPALIPLSLTETPKPGDFELATAARAADIYVAGEDFKVARIAADCLGADVERVIGTKPKIKNDARELSGAAVLIGTIGKSPLIDELVRTGKIETKPIVGQWESFVIATVTNPVPGVNTALVIAGSDRRGTAYGVFTLSEAIGVSPWVWWADVPPQKRTSLAIRATTLSSLPPSVKYRGIFINDEDWGLQPWAAKTFEPETRDIGPKTYAKVCELLLRLKANYLWPAMHPCTKAFNIYPQNKIVADDYAIVMGSSHCEQMLRNNVTEYDEKTNGPWDYDQNRANILSYWQQRLEENGKFENVYTIGMRGIHDGSMPGGGTAAEKVARLQRVIDDQRELVAKAIDPDPATVPQIFCPYKEVLALYQNGLKVPDDVALVWPDDNYGYIRQLSNPQEQKRTGGSGVYYHISYWGAPEDYLWLCTTPPALIWEEMHKAYENGARKIWVVNVGDIKPGEIGLEFFLRLAWDIGPWNETAQPTFLADWAGRNFGKAHADEIAAVLDEYYRLNFPSKPEHLHLSQFTTNYGEINQRLLRFAQLVKKTDAIYEKLPREQRDAFYELVVYPVRGSASVNEMHLGGSSEQKSQAYERIQTETQYFNEQLAGGKWRHILSPNPRNRPALRQPDPGAKTDSMTAAPGSESMSPIDGFISLEAERPTRALAGSGTAWKTIQGLGRSGDSIALLPTTAAVPASAALEYEFTVEKTGDVKALVYCLPTQPIHPGMKARYAISIDASEARTVDIATAEFSRPWSTNVLRAAAIGTTAQVLAHPGKHTLKLQPLDPGLVFDKIVVDLGGLKPTHLGPPEPRVSE